MADVALPPLCPCSQYRKAVFQIRTPFANSLHNGVTAGVPVSWNVSQQVPEHEVLVLKSLYELRTIGWSCDTSVDRRRAGPT
jgi:hypothetical protein